MSGFFDFIDTKTAASSATATTATATADPKKLTADDLLVADPTAASEVSTVMAPVPAPVADVISLSPEVQVSDVPNTLSDAARTETLQAMAELKAETPTASVAETPFVVMMEEPAPAVVDEIVAVPETVVEPVMVAPVGVPESLTAILSAATAQLERFKGDKTAQKDQKKAQIEEKRSQIATLESEIGEIESQITAIDSDLSVADEKLALFVLKK